MADLARVRALLAAAQEELAGVDQPGAAPTDVPPARAGYVAVHPTGPRGAGKVRYYPFVVPYDAKSQTGDYSEWGYAIRLSQIVNPDTGAPYWPPGMMMPPAPVHQPYMPDWSDWPSWIDYWLHPEDWYDQEELDRREKMRLADQARGVRFSPN